LYYAQIYLRYDSLNITAIDYYEMALQRQNRYDEMLPFLDQLIKMDTANARFYVKRGMYKLLLSDDTSGFSDLKWALKSDSINPSELFEIGAILFGFAEDKHDSLFNTKRFNLSHLSEREKDRLEWKKNLFEREACYYLEKTFDRDSLSFYNIRPLLITLYKRQGMFAKADSLEQIEHPIVTDSLFNPLSPFQLYFLQQYFLDTINVHNSNKNDSSFYDNRMLIAANRNSYFSDHLQGFEEPLIYSRNDDTEIYRFLWMRSFDEPFVIRMEKTKEEQYVIVKKKNGISGGQLGEIVMNDTIPLSESQWADFVDVLNESDFWETPSIEKTEQLINDGAYWIVEGRLHDKYHVVYRHSPSRYRDPKFRQLGLYMLELCNLDLTDSEIY